MLIQKIFNVFVASSKGFLPSVQDVPPPPPPAPVVPGVSVNESIIVLVVFAIGFGFYISNKYRFEKQRM